MSRDCQWLATSLEIWRSTIFGMHGNVTCNSGHERGVAIRKERTSSGCSADFGERIPRAICDLECGAGDELCGGGAETGSACGWSAPFATGEPQDDEGCVAGISPGGCDADGGWGVLAGDV